jgi:hypothetical protein
MSDIGTSAVAPGPIPTITAVPAGRIAAIPAARAAGWPEHSISASTSPGLLARGDGARRAGALRQREPVLVRVARHQLGRAERARDLEDEQPDRAGAGDQHAIAGAHAGLAARPDADRERLHQRALLVGQRVRQREREVLVDRDVVRERPVDGRRREDDDVGAEVVAAGAALAAAPARYARLERHAVADGVPARLLPERHDPAGGLVAEHERCAHDVVADPPVLVVVDVRAADADGADLDEHLARPGLGHRALLDPDVPGGVQHGGAVGVHASEATSPARGRGGALADAAALPQRIRNAALRERDTLPATSVAVTLTA